MGSVDATRTETYLSFRLGADEAGLNRRGFARRIALSISARHVSFLGLQLRLLHTQQALGLAPCIVDLGASLLLPADCAQDNLTDLWQLLEFDVTHARFGLLAPRHVGLWASSCACCAKSGPSVLRCARSP